MEQYKILLLGNTNRGKTTFLHYNCFKQFIFPEKTLGVEVFPFKFKYGKIKTIFNVWDTAGDERYKGLDDGYYIGAKGAIIFYSSKKEKNKYIQKVKRIDPNIKIVLVYSHINRKESEINIPKGEKHLNCVLNLADKMFMKLPFIYMASELELDKKDILLNHPLVNLYKDTITNISSDKLPIRDNYKICLVGETNRGKTTLAFYNSFQQITNHVKTLGVEVNPIDFKYDDLEFVFNVWDTAGDKRYKGLEDGYYIKADGAIIFYSNEKEKNKYIQKIQEFNKNIKIVLVYSYIDEEKFSITKEDKFINCAINMKNGEFMKLPFIYMASEIIQNKREQILNDPIVTEYKNHIFDKNQ